VVQFHIGHAVPDLDERSAGQLFVDGSNSSYSVRAPLPSQLGPQYIETLNSNVLVVAGSGVVAWGMGLLRDTNMGWGRGVAARHITALVFCHSSMIHSWLSPPTLTQQIPRHKGRGV
jgi:hypothetical protein